MNKRIFGLLLLAISAQTVSAQDEYDALRYSLYSVQGTARGMSIGGAVGSIGGDFTSLSVNPAGIGVYRSGEISFSPSFSASNTETKYLNSTSSSSASKMNFTHFGIVLTHAKKGNAYKKSAWKTASFAFGMNRQSTFKNQLYYTGNNYNSSIIERFADDFNRLGGLNNNTLGMVNYGAYAAYQTYLIDRGMGADSNQAVSYVPYSDGLIQQKRVITRGGMTEYVISGGGNYKEKLMLGATLGITMVNYERDFAFEEQDLSGKLNNDFKYLQFTENLKTVGTGINLKIGAIYKPNNMLRLGLALHTPTHIELNDQSSISMTSHTDSLLLHNDPNADPAVRYVQDTALIFKYALNTPFKAVGSFAIFFNQYGFLTADIEYVNYSGMKYDFGTGYENESQAANAVIQKTFKNAMNIRIGGEAKLGQVGIRGGYAYQGSPYQLSDKGSAIHSISCGVGIRGKSWYLDGSYIHRFQNLTDTPYLIDRTSVASADVKTQNGNVVVTLGFRF
ncbi:MAG: outer membrane protein transport protein [Chitinophagaceae bacterium]|nr:outer membrane protein transport protein [Chitinophagaceae bacterium]